VAVLYHAVQGPRPGDPRVDGDALAGGTRRFSISRRRSLTLSRLVLWRAWWLEVRLQLGQVLAGPLAGYGTLHSADREPNRNRLRPSTPVERVLRRLPNDRSGRSALKARLEWGSDSAPMQPWKQAPAWNENDVEGQWRPRLWPALIVVPDKVVPLEHPSRVVHSDQEGSVALGGLGVDGLR